jgi:excisionase family DNA binding protein
VSELYTVEECAIRAKCHPKTIKRQILAGNLKATRIGSLVRIRAGDWEEYLCRSGDTAPAGRLASNAAAGASARLSEAVAMLPSLKDALSSGSKIIGLEERRNTRSRKRSSAG